MSLLPACCLTTWRTLLPCISFYPVMTNLIVFLPCISFYPVMTNLAVFLPCISFCLMMSNQIVFLSLQRKKSHIVFTVLLASLCLSLVCIDVTSKPVSKSHPCSLFVNLALLSPGSSSSVTIQTSHFLPPSWLLEHKSPFSEPLLLSFYSVSSWLTSQTAISLALCILPHLASEPRAGYCLCIDTLDLSPACSVSWGPYIRLPTGHHFSIPPTACNTVSTFQCFSLRGQGAVCS